MRGESRPPVDRDLSARAAQSSEVLFRELDGESVLLNLESGRYFGLDIVGTRVWELLGEHGQLNKVHEVMLAEFEVDAARLRTDLVKLISELAKAGLVALEKGVSR